MLLPSAAQNLTLCLGGVYDSMYIKLHNFVIFYSCGY